ncbi:tetratricopeptide repeat protein [Helicobacter felis]|uniref:tetratricopeptide repeat protein n=1 Tax=Helicobacter felis TaxID=214 RepID=UPI000CF164A0|nr:SEL1-like repeat protein [Helicobacter felis]
MGFYRNSFGMSVLIKIITGFLVLWVACVPLRGSNLDEGIGPLLYEGINAESHHNYKKAYKIYQQAHEAGNVLGTALLGKLYAYGLGVEVNPGKAKVYFHIVLKDTKVKHESSLAIKYNQAGEVGNERYSPTFLSAAMIVANLGLAHLYQEGLGMGKSPRKAFKLYKHILVRMGANKGHGFMLGMLTGIATFGVGEVLARSVAGHSLKLKNLPVALIQKLPYIKTLVSQTLYEMGMAYKMGIGTGKSRSKAKECFQMAIDLGSNQALEAMRDLQ